MSIDTQNEALDKIQDIANYLLTRDDLPDEVCKYLEIIEALTRHRDLSNFLSPDDNGRLARIRRTQ